MIPMHGDKLSIEVVHDIVNAIEYRQLSFRNEDLRTSVAVVLLNYGEQYREVRCTNGEWGGTKQEVSSSRGIPTCPDGHPMFEEPNRIALGWVGEEF